MSVFSKNIDVDHFYDSFLFVPSDDKKACVVVDRTKLIATEFAFAFACVSPRFHNIIMAAPTMYQEVARQLELLENLSLMLERIPNINPKILLALSETCKSAELTLLLARNGVDSLADALDGETKSAL